MDCCEGCRAEFLGLEGVWFLGVEFGGGTELSRDEICLGENAYGRAIRCKGCCRKPALRMRIVFPIDF